MSNRAVIVLLVVIAAFLAYLAVTPHTANEELRDPGAYYHVSADWCADQGGEYTLINDLSVCVVRS